MTFVTDWTVQVLDKITNQVDYGLTASAKDCGDGPKFLRITDIQNGLVDWSTVPVCECKPEEREKYRLRQGDIVFARTGATTGKSYLITDCLSDTVFASYLIRVRPNNNVLPPYLAYFFQTPDYWEQVSQSSSGSAQPGVNATKLKNLRVPFPTLPEQERIVAILDEAFAAIAAATANAEKNIANVRELFESHVSSVFDQKRDEWSKTTLGESCEFHNGKAHEKHIEANGEYIVVNSKYISSDGSIFKRTNDAMFPLNKSDIVMVMSDVPKGKALAKCIIIDEDGKYTLNQRICAIRSQRFESRFLFYHLNRHPFLLGFDNGENQTNLRKGDILKCPLFCPPLEVQDKIGNELEEFSIQHKSLEDVYERKATLLTQLKQSILHRAFTGELSVDPNPA